MQALFGGEEAKGIVAHGLAPDRVRIGRLAERLGIEGEGKGELARAHDKRYPRAVRGRAIGVPHITRSTGLAAVDHIPFGPVRSAWSDGAPQQDLDFVDNSFGERAGAGLIGGGGARVGHLHADRGGENGLGLDPWESIPIGQERRSKRGEMRDLGMADLAREAVSMSENGDR